MAALRDRLFQAIFQLALPSVLQPRIDIERQTYLDSNQGENAREYIDQRLPPR
jgi:hypothetical protein